MNKNPIRIDENDWAEIAATLDLKRWALKEGNYRPCLKHGPSCTTCDTEWIKQIERIIETIGPDGQDAAKRGVAACK